MADAPIIEPDSPLYDSVEMPITPPYEDVGKAEQYLPCSLSNMVPQHFDVAVLQPDLPILSYGIPQADPLQRASVSRVTGYCFNEGHEHYMLQMLLHDFAKHHCQYVDQDGKAPPFVILPTFHESSAEYLLKICKSQPHVIDRDIYK